MSGLLIASLALLFGGIAGTLGADRLGLRLGAWIGPGSLAVTALVWVFGRSLVPWQWSPSAAVGVTFPHWQLAVDAVSWEAALWLLLLGLAVAGTVAGNGDSRGATWAVAATAVGLLSLWVGTVSGWLLTFTLLLCAWAALAWVVAGPDGPGRSGLWWRLGAAALCLPLVWLGSLLEPTGGVDVPLASLPASPWTILAGVVLLLVSPWSTWRIVRQGEVSPHLPLLAALPAVHGLVLLARASAPSGATMTVLLSVIGLVSLLLGVLSAWRALDAPCRSVSALGLAMVGLIFLSRAWAGVEAVLAEGRLMVLGIGALWLLLTRAPDSGRRLASVLVAAAIAGLPLTAAFGARAALFGIWVTDSRWLLLVVTAILLVPLAAAALSATGFWTPAESRKPRLEWAWSLIPVFGLVGVGGLSTAGLPAWVVGIAAGLLAVGLSLRVGDGKEIAPVIRQGLALVDVPAVVPLGSASGFLGGLKTALREAANILESEGGMLWLLLFLVIFWLARG